MDGMAAYPPPPPPPGSVHYPYYHQPPPQPPPPVAPPPTHHLVHPYYPPQPLPYSPYATPLFTQAAYDEVRTLFVEGLPEDVNAREIYNLFRYDEGSGSDKKARGSSYSRATTDPGVGSIEMPGMGNSSYNMIGYLSAPSHGSFSGSGGNETIASNMSSAQHFPQNNTPCPTLFVANLGPTCTEQELIQVFSRFIKLKMQSTYGAPVAFVDFQDTASSTVALSHLQGTVLYSSTSGEGMRLEFAESRMGMRKKPK